MLNLKPLHHFVLVAEEGSFLRAAERANITQPALSNSIRGLEESLGVQLFERQQRPAKITPTGQDLLRSARKLLFEARNLDQEVANLKTGQAGHLRVGFVPNFASNLGGSIVSDWLGKSGTTSIEVVTGANERLLASLKAEELDLIVCDPNGVADPTNLEFLDMPSLPGACFCRAGHPILQIERPTGRDLKRYRLATVSITPELLHRVAGALGLEREADTLLTVTCSNVLLLQDLIVQSDTILMGLRPSLRLALTSGMVREIPFDLNLSSTWSITTLQGKTLHPAARHLIASIQKVAAEELAESRKGG